MAWISPGETPEERPVLENGKQNPFSVFFRGEKKNKKQGKGVHVTMFGQCWHFHETVFRKWYFECRFLKTLISHFQSPPTFAPAFFTGGSPCMPSLQRRRFPGRVYSISTAKVLGNSEEFGMASERFS